MNTPVDNEFLSALADVKGSMDEIVDFVNSHPELAHEEFQCSAYLMDRLRSAGYSVEAGVGGVPTAFRAELAGDLPGATVGLVAVYDATPSLSSEGTSRPLPSCGHGPQSAGVIGAALALAANPQSLRGSVVVMGCPADEIHSPLTRKRGSGKALSVTRGVWDGIDFALYPHPEFINTVWDRTLWMRRETVLVVGTRTLKKEAVNSVMHAFMEIAKISEDSDPSRLMIETVLLDGDVEESASMKLEASFLIFADSEDELVSRSRDLRTRFGPATWATSAEIAPLRADEQVTMLVASAFAAAGADFDADPPALPFATDFGNVSQHIPAALTGVGRQGGWRYHTEQGAEEFCSPAGKEVAESIARVIGLAVLRLGASAAR